MAATINNNNNKHNDSNNINIPITLLKSTLKHNHNHNHKRHLTYIRITYKNINTILKKQQMVKTFSRIDEKRKLYTRTSAAVVAAERDVKFCE
ncbi:Hypothetical predicted protein [Octopus vulgaris]|uniref:Uncharacterized protein n=1 Tax=Octopus vulgaris TaxID=6645 RepID=A0AA36B0H3_OCTVU|nr:Hypothetical predicted protein [Octopus vulgaris]